MTEHLPASGTRMMWAEAAESIAAKAAMMGSGAKATVMDLLHARVLRYCGDGIGQYLAVKLADVSEAKQLLRQLRKQAANWPPERLVQRPGARAQLYKLARQLGTERLQNLPSIHSGQRAQIPWRVQRAAVSPAYADALEYFRCLLDPLHAELLELHFARELTEEEISFVVDQDLQTINSELERLVSDAQGVIGSNPPSRIAGLAGVLIEAFAVDVPQDKQNAAEADDDMPPLQQGMVLGERYAIEHCAGRGAFGDVYRARDTEIEGHHVALKLLHHAAVSEKAKAQSLRELRLIASVFHPSVVDFKDHGWFQDRLWFVMPWYEGETLEARITRQPLSRVEARRVFQPLARALATMHATGVRHQDIKPDNIFLAQTSGFGLGMIQDDNLLPVLLDLGVAATEAEVFLAGTPQYFAPEVAAPFAKRVGGEISGKADVFSLALSLRNALEPSTQEDVQGGAVEAFIEHRSETSPELPQSKDLKFLRPSFQRWLAVDPDQRPSAEEFAQELAILTKPEETKQRWLRTLRWLGPVLLTVGVVFGAVIFGFAKQAEVQRLRAQRARTEAAMVKADLNELEEDIDELQKKYRNTAFTRRDLVRKLAKAESRTGFFQARLTGVSRRASQLNTDLAKTKDELQSVNERLLAENERTEKLTADLSNAQERLQLAKEELEAARDKGFEISAQLTEAKASAARAVADAEQYKSELAKQQQSQADLKRDVSRLEAEIDRLSKQIRSLNKNKVNAAPSGGTESP